MKSGTSSTSWNKTEGGYVVNGSGSLTSSEKVLGLIAGIGDLPRAVSLEARNLGYRVVGIALQPPADESLRPFVDSFHRVHIGRVGEIFRILRKLSVREIVMAGKVPKSLLYGDRKKIVPDLRTVKLLLSLKNRSDDTFLEVIEQELEREGITLLSTSQFTKKLLTPNGVLTKKKPKKDHWNDIRFGWKIAKEIGRLDIGQTVVIRKMAVMAVEAIEGTDEAIRRGGTLAKEGAVVIKVSKPQQDMRFDVPAVGLDTLYSMKDVKADVLALEAGKTIIVERERFLREADKAGISVIGLDEKKVTTA